MDELTSRDVREREKRRKDNAKTGLGCGVLLLFGLIWYSASGDGGDDGAASYPMVSSTSARGYVAPAQGAPAGGGSHERFITRTSGLTPWPFTVESGVLRCRPGQQVTFEAGSREYGVNGLAQARYPKPFPVWADDLALGNGLKVDISAVLNVGLALC
ncbi:hypothetical protein ACIQOW_03640 [Kitasatospora sp. NPDC091335]|uniref:hypothetical protein n=1 Tax=Kitasatospora sp. NPDC091335 TaxID=3364085 RepID=UPI00382F1A8F